MSKAQSQFTEDEVINMRLRIEAGETWESVAEDYDTTTNTVRYQVDPDYRRYKHEYGLWRRGKGPRPRNPNQPTKHPVPGEREDFRRVLEGLRDQGVGRTDAAAQLGITDEAMRAYCESLKVRGWARKWSSQRRTRQLANVARRRAERRSRGLRVRSILE